MTDTSGDPDKTCFIMGSGANVNMNGYKITCSNGGGICFGAAIKALAAGTIVENGTIDGKWEYGTYDAEITRYMSFVGTQYAGVGGDLYVKKIQHNVFNGCGYYCVETHIDVSTGGLIEHNRLETNPHTVSQGTIAIEIEGTDSGSGPIVRNNYIIRGTNGASEIGIETDSASNVRIFDNIIAEREFCTTGITERPIYLGSPTNPNATVVGNDCCDFALCPILNPYFMP